MQLSGSKDKLRKKLVEEEEMTAVLSTLKYDWGNTLLMFLKPIVYATTNDDVLRRTEEQTLIAGL